MSEKQKAKSEMQRNLCIIPARGGSKRIPRKNIKPFLGKPIIAYSIEVAIQSGLFDEVMVSTDDKEIAEVAKTYGAEIPFMRSDKNADDYATTLDVVKEVLGSYKSLNKTFENICIIYPTAPFVTVRCLEEGLAGLDNNRAAIPVVEFDFPVWRSFKVKGDRVAYQWPEFEKTRSQDLEPLYHDAGQWYWIKYQENIDSLVPKDTAPVYLNRMEVQDIDTLQDWKLAELKYQHLRNGTRV